MYGIDWIFVHFDKHAEISSGLQMHLIQPKILQKHSHILSTTATFNLIHGQKDNSFLSGGLQSIAEEKHSERA